VFCDASPPIGFTADSTLAELCPEFVDAACPDYFDTLSPTVLPTAAPTFDINNILNWADLKAACSHSACDTATGGCIIPLSDDFVMMRSYTSEIDFSGKTITIWGQETVLDASGGGRFFSGEGAGSFLELHDVVLQNGQSSSVSGRVLVCEAVLRFVLKFAPIPGGEHATSRVKPILLE
jgi:hypothetical protein